MLAIIGAMQEEVDEILALMESYEEKNISNIKHYHGFLNNVEVLILLSGVGKVSAALSLTVMLEHYKIEGIINIGTAGGLKEDEEVMDVVIATKVAYHDFDISPFGVERSFNSDRYVYNCDKRLTEIVNELISENDRVHVGPMISGDQFIYKKEQLDFFKSNYPEAICAEMEAGGIAQVCEHYNKPFVVIRSLSDITLRNDNHLTFDEYVKLASKRSAAWCYKLVSSFDKILN